MTLDKQYQNLLSLILETGSEKEDRTGTGTLSLFGQQIRHNMSKGFPLLTTKKLSLKTIVTELKWFLKGDTNIKYLVDNKCNIWNGDAYKNYRSKFQPTTDQFTPDTIKEFINKIETDDRFVEGWGDLGPIYGKQWRDWGGYKTTRIDQNKKKDGFLGFKTDHTLGVDQIKNLITEIKTNPDSRRLMVSAWNVGELKHMTLPPCHYGFQCYVSDLSPLEIIDQAKKDGLWKYTIPKGMRLGELQKDFKTKKLSLMWNQRSVDTFLGLPFNIASYGMLLTLLSEEVGMIPGDLIGNLGDTHLYSNHIEQAKEQISRHEFSLPTIKLSNINVLNGEFEYELINYLAHPNIKAPLSN